MADNVDFVRNVVTRMPSIGVLATYIVILSIVFGSISAFMFSELKLLSIDLSTFLISILSLYLLPSFLTGEITNRFVSSGRCWMYLTAIFDEIILFTFSLIILLTDTISDWWILGLGVITIFVINMLMIMAVRGRIDPQSILYSTIYPTSIIITFYLASDILVRNFKELYLQVGLFVVAPVLLLLFTMKLFDFLIHSNIHLSLLDFSSTFLLKDPKSIEGVNGSIIADVFHQALRIGDKDDEQIFSIPWVHSGPAAGFGSGLLFPKVTDENTFLLHIPGNHTLNMANAEEVDNFKQAPEAQKSEKASKLQKLEKEGFTLWGRKYRGAKMIYIQNREIDDYLPSIAYDLKEKYGDICLIDLHNQLKDQGEKQLQHMDKERKVFEEAVSEMVEILEDAEMKDYKAGVSNKEEFCALVEQVGDQRTCLLGINASCGMPVLHELEDELDYDQNLVFSTDSHEDPVDLNSVTEPQYDKEELKKTAKQAEKSVKSTKAGIGEKTVKEIELIGIDGDYIIATVNILARLVPLLIILYFISVIAISGLLF